MSHGTSSNFRDSLLRHLSAHSELRAVLNDSSGDRLVQHYELLSQWNKTHNLIAVTDIESLVSEHYLDCAQALSLWIPQLKGKDTIFDLGAGNGFPGVIGAAMWPEHKFTLVESLRKKCSFLRAARVACKLQNLQVEQTRVQNLKEIKVAISRAAFSNEFIDDLADSFSSGGILALMRVPSEEFLSNRTKVQWMVVDQLNYTLDTGAERCVVILEKRT